MVSMLVISNKSINLPRSQFMQKMRGLGNNCMNLSCKKLYFNINSWGSKCIILISIWNMLNLDI